MKKKIVLAVLMVTVCASAMGCTKPTVKITGKGTSNRTSTNKNVNDDYDDYDDYDFDDDIEYVDDDIEYSDSDMLMLIGDYEQTSGNYYLNNGLISIEDDYVSIDFDGVGFDSTTNVTYLGNDTIDAWSYPYDPCTGTYEYVDFELQYFSGGELAMTIIDSENTYFEEGDVIFFEEY